MALVAPDSNALAAIVSYGIIGSVMILMLWIFLACQLFLAGCEFSCVHAHLFGTKRRATQFEEMGR